MVSMHFTELLKFWPQWILWNKWRIQVEIKLENKKTVILVHRWLEPLYL